MEKVSVIIPTYNRFNFLLNAINSAFNQTYKNIEVIVVNDCSTQEEYYSYDFKTEFGENFYILHLPKNSRKIFGNICGGGNSRNIGMMLASGEYIAFLDDDDNFLPTKIEKQIEAMKNSNCSISCTEAYGGKGPYNPLLQYRKWHYEGIYWNRLITIFSNKDKKDLLEKMYQSEINIWDESSIKVHNCNVCSSVVMKKELIKKAGYFPLKGYAEDWEYWTKLFKHSKCVFLREPLTYIDMNHGDGKNY